MKSFQNNVKDEGFPYILSNYDYVVFALKTFY